MHHNRPAPNGEHPPGGGRRVVPSRAARHAQQAPDDGQSWDGQPWDGGHRADSWDGYPYPPDGYSPNGRSPNDYGRHGGPSEGYPPEAYRQDEFQPNGYAPYGYEQNGHSANGYAANNGYASNGHGSNGRGSNGYASNGYAPETSAYPGNGHQPSGYAPDGYHHNGYHQNGHSQNGYGQNGYGPQEYRQDGYPTGDHTRNGYPQNGYTQNGHRHSGGYAPDGHPQHDDTQNGYAQNGYGPARHAPSGPPPPGGGPANGGRPPFRSRVTPSRAARHAQRQRPPQDDGGRGPYARGDRSPTGYFPPTPPGGGYRGDGARRPSSSRSGGTHTGYPRDGAPAARSSRTGTLPPAPAPRRGSRQEFHGERRPSSSGRSVTPSRAARHGPPSRSRGRHSRRRQRSFWTELPVLIVAAFVLAIGVKGYVVQAFYIPSGSMEPTLQVNDRILVNRLAYRAEVSPEHGDVIVFVRRIPGAPPPEDGAFAVVRRAVAQGLGNAPPGSEDLIKRVVGREGDVIEGKDGRLWRNNQPVDEPYLPPGTVTTDFGPVTIEPDHLWVMGDNRANSADSRVFGQIHEQKLVGQAVILVWPFEHAGSL